MYYIIICHNLQKKNLEKGEKRETVEAYSPRIEANDNMNIEHDTADTKDIAKIS